jgi:hypothetical protein
MVVELQLVFKDEYTEGDAGDEPIEITYTLTAPAGMEVTGGQIFVERTGGGELDRFSFRVDRDRQGVASLTILENVGA